MMRTLQDTWTCAEQQNKKYTIWSFHGVADEGWSFRDVTPCWLVIVAEFSEEFTASIVEYPEGGCSKHLHTLLSKYQSTRRSIVEDFVFTTKTTKSTEIFKVRR